IAVGALASSAARAARGTRGISALGSRERGGLSERTPGLRAARLVALGDHAAMEGAVALALLDREPDDVGNAADVHVGRPARLAGGSHALHLVVGDILVHRARLLPV